MERVIRQRARHERMVALALAAGLCVLAGSAPGSEGHAGAQLRPGALRELAAGKVLIASRALGDPNFVQTVVLLAEHNEQGANPRFVVTNLRDAPQALYEQLYCARGEMENRIKECQLGLFADRTSCHLWWPNQFRLLLASLAPIALAAPSPSPARAAGDPAGAAPPAPRRPSAIVLVTVDTLRADAVSFAGYGLPTTPFLDRMAQDGVVFTQAYAPSSWTPPSMASIFTGLAPSSRPTYRSGRSPMTRSRCGRTNDHAPWFSGSSCTQRTSSTLGYRATTVASSAVGNG